MFVAKFNQVTSDKFEADKNTNMPFIGEVLAGTANGTIINGTMFQRNGLKPQTLYACENYIDEKYPTLKDGRPNNQVRIIAEVSIVEFISLRTVLGAPKVSLGTVEATEAVELDDERIN
jgi:hypothetical protein